MKHYSTPEQVVSALRATKSESKRVLLDTAANMIEAFHMAADALREQEERGKECNNCRWKDRHQKCSCCKRNRGMKDCYEEDVR